MRVPSAAGMKILSKISEGRPTKQRGMTRGGCSEERSESMVGAWRGSARGMAKAMTTTCVASCVVSGAQRGEWKGSGKRRSRICVSIRALSTIWSWAIIKIAYQS